MPYKGDTFTLPLVAAGLGYPRNPLASNLGSMENIRNCNLHELGVGKRGGTSVLNNMTGNPRVTGLKQFISKQGDEYILRATSDGKYWKNNTDTIKTALSIRDDEVLAEGGFITHAKWGHSGDFNKTGGNLAYTHSTGEGRAWQSAWQIPAKGNKTYEFTYTVSGKTGDPTCSIVTNFALTETFLTLTNGVQATQFLSKAVPTLFELKGISDSAGDDFTLDDLSLKKVIAPPVDISVYNKNAIFTNGKNPPQVFSGLRFLEVPGTLVAGNAEEGAGNLDNAKYLYKVTLKNASGETSGGSVSNEIDIADNTIDGQAKLTGLPTGPNEVIARVIYRTEGGGSAYKLLTTINDNITTMFIDNVADGSLGAAIPTDNTATTGTVTTDLGGEGINRPSTLTATLSASGPCSASLDGAGNVDTGSHSYIVVFIDADNVHTDRGTKSNVVTAAGGGSKIQLSKIPIGPIGTVRRDVYRTKAGDTGEYYELVELADNTTTIFEDDIADINIGSEVLTNGALTGGSDWTVSNDFAFVAGRADYVHAVGDGVLNQLEGSFNNIVEKEHRYEFIYTVVSVTNPGNIDAFVLAIDSPGETQVNLDKTAATHSVIFVSSLLANMLAIGVVSSGASDISLDNLSLLEIAGEGGGIDAGTHTYQVTFVNIFGETVGGSISASLTTDAFNGIVNLTDIPIGPTGVTARRIYRTIAGGSQHKLLTTISDNITTTYIDKIVDADLGGNVPTSNTAAARPSDWIGTNNPKYAFEHAVGNTEGIIFFGCEENPDQVYIIPDGSEDASDANIKQFTFKSKVFKEKNVLVGGIEYGTNLLMFSQDTSWLIDKSSLDVADWTYVKLPWKGGTINNKTLVLVNNDIHSMELDGNIYSVKRVQESGNTSIASLTKPSLERPQSIDRWMRDNIDLSRANEFHGVFDEGLQAVLWSMVRQGQTQIDTALAYFVNFDRWIIMDNRDNNSGFSASVSTVVINNNNTKTIYTGDYGGNVWFLNQPNKNDGGNAYWAGFKLHPMNMPTNDIVRNRSYDHMFIVQEINEDVDLEVQGFVEGVSIPADSIESSKRYTKYTFGRIGRDAAVEIYNNTVDEDFFIMALIFYYELLDIPLE